MIYSLLLIFVVLSFQYYGKLAESLLGVFFLHNVSHVQSRGWLWVSFLIKPLRRYFRSPNFSLEEPSSKLKFGFLSQKFRIDGGGLFQGMILTPFLNELYLHQLDLCLKQKHIPFVRFGDELMVLAREEAGASKALDVVQRQLLKLGLVADHSQVVRSSFKYKFVGKRLPNSDGLLESLVGHKPEPEPVGMWQRLINRG